MIEYPSEESPVRQRWAALTSIASAHAIMLRDVGLIEDEALAVLLGAIERAGGSTPEGEGLLSLIETFDERIDAQSPTGMVGVSRVGRGTPETIASVGRLLLRDALFATLSGLNALQRTLLAFARQHVVTLIPVYLDGQYAQPSTLGHWTAATIASLARVAWRLEAALAETNRSPMGSGALASSGMPVDRDRVAELLGFDGLVANTLDAVSATDHLSMSADALGALTVTIRRFADELLTWCRVEPASFRLPDASSGFVSDLPQVRTPRALAELAAAARSVSALAGNARTLADAVSPGPWLSGGDAPLDVLLDAHYRAQSLVTSARHVVETLEINRALLANRAGKGFGTSSDLADFLMIEEHIDPGAARNIAALTISRTREQGLEASGVTPEFIDAAALMVIGREIKAEFEAISRYLAPRRFIERRVATGAPSPAATRALLDADEQELDRQSAVIARVAANRQRADADRERLANEVRAMIGGA